MLLNHQLQVSHTPGLEVLMFEHYLWQDKPRNQILDITFSMHVHEAVQVVISQSCRALRSVPL